MQRRCGFRAASCNQWDASQQKSGERRQPSEGIGMNRTRLSLAGLLQRSTVDWVAHTQQKWIPHSSRDKTLRSGCQRGRVRAPSRLQMAGSSLCPHVAEGVRELTEVSSFTQALIAFIEVSPSRPNLLPKVPPPRTVTLGEKDFDIWILETHRCSVHDRTKARGEATVGRNRWWRHVWWVSGYQVRERATLQGE